MRKLPKTVNPYKRTPLFDETSIPDGLRKDHKTKPGVWGVITVESGQLLYKDASVGAETVLTPGAPGTITPESPHAVQPLGAVSFYVEFWR